MTDQTTDTTVDQTTDTTDTTASANVSLSLQDLLLTAQALQIAAQRGAFKAEEFSQVGKVFDHLVAFLTSSGALTPTASSAPSSDETTSSTTDNEPAEEADGTVAE